VTISAGTRLGPYEIVAPIGAGGMGEVYKARDVRLDRTVAVKILPAEFAQNTQLKVRFEREARTISQLSHPNICALYDVGENYLVMELLDGETVAERLSRGPLPLTDVLKYGAQIAEALGKAHREGVIHRDLKPGNVMLTKSGAKLLDFGLAKSIAQAGTPVEATLQKPLTQEGFVLGTFQYMAPEQLAGEEPDARTDIFALGAVLYEMATGKRAFEGKTKTSLVAAIVSADPKPISELQPLTPPALEHAIRKCLAKERDDRWQSAADIAEELRWIGQERATTQRHRVWPLMIFSAALALIIGALAGAWSAARNRVVPPMTYSEINPPDGAAFIFDAASAVVSPDGKMLAFVAQPRDGQPTLWVRPLDSPVSSAFRSTENALFPFWAPDSKSIGFFADGKLKRIAIDGGAPETVAVAGTPRGGAWSPDGTILFTPTPASPLFRVPAAGGEVRQVTTLNEDRGDTSHRFPVFLPDGRHFLFFIQGASEFNVAVGSLDSKDTHTVATAEAGIVFVPPDWVLLLREGVLRVQRIDLKTFHLTGEAVPLAEGLQSSGSLNFVNVSASTNGVLTFARGSSATASTLTFFDRAGKDLGTVGNAPAEQVDVAVAPDEHAVAVARYGTSASADIWVADLHRNIQTRQTFSPANEFAPVWSPDSGSIVFSSFDKSPGDLWIKYVDSSGPGQVFFADRRRKVATSWSPDGNYVIFHVLTPGMDWDIEAYSIRDRRVIPLVKTPATEIHGQVSPDSKWLAYSSTESGRMEVFVRPFLGGNEHWQISGGGGAMPRWSHDGRQLYFVTPDAKLMVAVVHSAATFSADLPKVMFQTQMRLVTGVTRLQYDVMRDGRLLINSRQPGAQEQARLVLVQNWTRKLPAQ
jgi:serine/threonine protein kinase